MGKHGVYVWGSFGVMAIVMIAEPLIVAQGQKRLIARLRRQLRAEKVEQAEQTRHLSRASSENT
ncbi:MAG: heme exporter protein CcmD [Propionivibrio sp.]